MEKTITYRRKTLTILTFNCMKCPLLCLFLLVCICCEGQLKTNYKVIAYYTGDAQSIQRYPLSKITHIIYSFLRLQHDTLTFRDSSQEETVKQLVFLKKQYPSLKIMVSIGGWGGCARCSDLFASAAHREMFAKTTVELFRKTGIDGLDLDWEYPAIEGYPGHVFDTADQRNFTGLVTALRKAMGKKYILSFAAGGFIKYMENSIDWPGVLPQVDFVNLMTYDLVGGYATVTGHHTPLSGKRPGEETTERCVNWLLVHQADSRKLIVGAAFYARIWENVPDTNHGLYQPGHFKQGVAFRDFGKFFPDSSGYEYFWDDVAKAPYRYDARDHLFATFDDMRSVRGKADFVKHKKLGGIMFWELSQDSIQNGLLEAMVEELRL